MARFQLPGATIFLTILIWAAADQLVTETDDIRAKIRVVAVTNSNLVVQPLRGAPELFSIRISGRQSEVRKLRDQGILRLNLTIDEFHTLESEIGLRKLHLRDEIQGIPELAGCVVQSVEPPTLDVSVDRRIEVSIPVRLRPGAMDYAVDPTLDIDSVRATLLQSRYDELKDSNPNIVVDAESYLREQPEDQPLRFSVPLPLKAETDVGTLAIMSIVPDSVTLRATLRLRLVHDTIPAVPIKFLVSHTVNNRYLIEFRDPNPILTLSVDVIGPQDAVDKLKSGEEKIFAMINIGTPNAFADGSYQFLKPEFNLPPGVTLQDNQRTEVEVRLIPRSQSDIGSPLNTEPP